MLSKTCEFGVNLEKRSSEMKGLLPVDESESGSLFECGSDLIFILIPIFLMSKEVSNVSHSADFS